MGVRKLSPRVADDVKVIGVIIALWIVQALLAVGPLREELEIMLILSLVPPIDLIIDVMKLLSTTEPGTIWFYIKLFVIFIKDILIGIFLAKRRHPA